MNDITFTHGLVCDDIRQEQSGKFIIVGMYTGAFAPSRLPAMVSLAFAVWGEVKRPGLFNCEFEIAVEPDGSPVAGLETQFEMSDDKGTVFIPFPKLPINIGSEGYIILSEKTTNQEIIRLKVNAPSTEPMPPSSQSPSDAND